MAVIRTTHFTAAADLEEMLRRRAKLIDVLRASYAGLTEARMTRQADGTYADAWRWESADLMQAAVAAGPTLPEATAAFAVVTDATVTVAEIVDER
ncbi:MAG TPA: hypothetical protein VF062_14985 [Candidatus Limnocylindrales bacterium]